jgi:peptidyl-tRNA hydrolase ICT1
MLRCTSRFFTIEIPKNRVELLYSRASGPGGQNIAASNAKVQLKFEIAKADWLPEVVRVQLSKHYGRVLVIASQESRSCRANEKMCFAKLKELVEKTENFLNIPKRDFDSFDAWLKSVRTEKQIFRHKARREESKRNDSSVRKNKRVEYE